MLQYNKLTGAVPALPFEQYEYCSLQAKPSGDPPTNRFACPLPPVTARARRCCSCGAAISC
jgi:hypothetical protein